jgi:hypothetical protein
VIRAFGITPMSVKQSVKKHREGETPREVHYAAQVQKSKAFRSLERLTLKFLNFETEVEGDISSV